MFCFLSSPEWVSCSRSRPLFCSKHVHLSRSCWDNWVYLIIECSIFLKLERQQKKSEEEEERGLGWSFGQREMRRTTCACFHLHITAEHHPCLCLQRFILRFHNPLLQDQQKRLQQSWDQCIMSRGGENCSSKQKPRNKRNILQI